MLKTIGNGQNLSEINQKWSKLTEKNDGFQKFRLKSDLFLIQLVLTI